MSGKTSGTNVKEAIHWADINAGKIIRTKKLDVPEADRTYVCASGITPSGTVHIGNFREIISVDLVVRALRDRGKQVRFIYSWDDYDVFRKVPLNMPNRELLEKYLRMPIVEVPDPWGRDASYARHHEADIERVLPVVGVEPEFLYQAERYRSSLYAAEIRRALERRDVIREILDEHRTTPLPEDWWPVSVFCTECRKDETVVEGWDGEWGVSYRCESCGHAETVDLRTTSVVKLPWRVDWPMRWSREQVDFEPAGKDHHSEGGSWTTAEKLVRRVYEYEPPVTFQYDFIGIKGRGGKISSSTGEVVSLIDVLEVYQPEVTRYLFAGTRPNTEFAISFDLDVIKIYEDYDKTERIYFGVEEVGEKRREKEARIYELSQVGTVPETMPVQVPFRHLCSLVLIHDGNIDRVIELVAGGRSDEEKARIRVRAVCAKNWVTTFAPESFRFSLNEPGTNLVELPPEGRAAVRGLAEAVENLDRYDEKTLAEELYAVAGRAGIEPKEFFVTVYRILISKDQGPRLAAFIFTIGRERILSILGPYRS